MLAHQGNFIQEVKSIMRMSALFSQTLREAPAEAEIPSHQLLLRAGFIRQLAAASSVIYPWLGAP